VCYCYIDRTHTPKYSCLLTHTHIATCVYIKLLYIYAYRESLSTVLCCGNGLRLSARAHTHTHTHTFSLRSYSTIIIIFRYARVYTKLLFFHSNRFFLMYVHLVHVYVGTLWGDANMSANTPEAIVITLQQSSYIVCIIHIYIHTRFICNIRLLIGFRRY